MHEQAYFSEGSVRWIPSLMDHFSDGILITDEHLNIVSGNMVWQKLFHEKVTGQQISTLKYYQKNTKYLSHYQNAWTSKQPGEHSEQLGEQILKVITYPTSTGLFILYKATQEQSIIDSEEKLRSVLESMITSFAFIDPQHRIIFFSKRLQNSMQLNFGKPMYSGAPVRDFVKDKDWPDFQNCLNRALQGDAIEKEDLYYVLNDNSPSWFYVSFSPVRNHSQEIIGATFNTYNIDARRKAEDELRKSNEKFRTILKATNDAVWEWILDNNRLEWNENIQLLFGYNQEEVENTLNWWDQHIHPDDHDPVVNSLMATFEKGESNWSGEYRFKCKDGSYKYVRDRGYVIYDDTNTPLKMIGSMQDIHLLKEHEVRILEQNKALKEIAHSQSHEVRRPLAAILGLVNLINQYQNPSEVNDLKEILDKLKCSAEELDQIIRKVVSKTNELPLD